MKIIGIIPSRYHSSRFPGKPLAIIKEKSMVQRVYEQVSKAKLINEVIVATDDQRIYDHVEAFGGKIMMTAESHKSGTERCNEVINKLAEKNIQYDVAINIQGDEPMIDPVQIDKLAACFSDNSIEIATLIKKINDYEDIFNPNTVKVVFDNIYHALYFSRAPIPWLRDIEKDLWLKHHDFYKHVGIYAYKTEILEQISKPEAGKLELAESLEQLKWLEMGYKIKLEITESENVDVNTPEDLSKIINKI